MKLAIGGAAFAIWAICFGYGPNADWRVNTAIMGGLGVAIGWAFL